MTHGVRCTNHRAKPAGVKPVPIGGRRGDPSRWVGRKGVNKIVLRGRIGGRTLTPGSYRLNAAAQRVQDRA